MGPQIGKRGISEALREFVEELPYERGPIFDFVSAVADSLTPGSVVLDVGAGHAPYREIFEHCRYITVDWSNSPHELATESDLIADAEALPIADSAADAALMTQVLEHVADPLRVLQETARALRPNGWLFLTVPFVWELHELPYDFWRYTPASLERLLLRAGFHELSIKARNDCFSTVAQLLHNLRWVMGRAPDGLDPQREQAAEVLDEAAMQVAALSSLDVAQLLPLGWNVRARRVDVPSPSDSHRRTPGGG